MSHKILPYSFKNRYSRQTHFLITPCRSFALTKFIAALAALLAPSTTALKLGAYVPPPDPTTSRGPCPGFNTMANHGVFPRDGSAIPRDRIVAAFSKFYSFSPAMSNAILDSAFAKGVGNPAAQTIDLVQLRAHNKIEHDVSLVRDDSFLGNNYLVNVTLFNEMLSFSATKKFITLGEIGRFRKHRFESCKKNDPELSFDTNRQDVALSEAAALAGVFGGRVRAYAPRGAEPGVTEPGGAEPGGAGSACVASGGASSRREVLSPRELREWFARRWSRAARAGGTPATTGSGGTGPGGAGAAGPGGTAEAAGVGPPGGSAGVSGGTGAAGSAGPAAAGATGVGAAGGVGAGGSADAGPSEGAKAGAAGAGGATGAGAPAGSPGAVPAGSGGASRPRPYFVPLLEQVLVLPPSPSPAPPLECPQPVQSQSLLQPVSPLPAPSPYTGPTGGLAERRAPASPARPACTSRRTSRPRPPAVPGTHQMALRPSTAPLRVPLPSPPATSLPTLPDPGSDSLRAASPTVARFLATVVTDPSLASTAASALVAELVDFAASCRLDYAASLVAESASVCPPSVGGECALSTDVLEDRQEEF
ncbi:unnamed protein product [Closterium sp. NIES-54]